MEVLATVTVVVTEVTEVVMVVTATDMAVVTGDTDASDTTVHSVVVCTMVEVMDVVIMIILPTFHHIPLLSMLVLMHHQFT